MTDVVNWLTTKSDWASALSAMPRGPLCRPTGLLVLQHSTGTPSRKVGQPKQPASVRQPVPGFCDIAPQTLPPQRPDLRVERQLRHHRIAGQRERQDAQLGGARSHERCRVEDVERAAALTGDVEAPQRIVERHQLWIGTLEAVRVVAVQRDVGDDG